MKVKQINYHFKKIKIMQDREDIRNYYRNRLGCENQKSHTCECDVCKTIDEIIDDVIYLISKQVQRF